jgi:hypothetical protein
LGDSSGAVPSQSRHTDHPRDRESTEDYQMSDRQLTQDLADELLLAPGI